MGSPYKTPWKLWCEKRGLLLEEDLSGNPHVQRGIREEPLARRRYEERHGELLLPVCAESRELPILRASFDGVTNEGRPIEIKAPAEKGFVDALKMGTQSCLYLRYYAQVQTQIFVAEADGGVLSLTFGDDFLDLPIPRDDAVIADIIEKSKAFWHAVETGAEPPLNPERDIYQPKGVEERQWFNLAEEYRRFEMKRQALSSELKSLEGPIAKVEERLLDLMGDFLVADAGGLRVSRFLQQGSIDYKAALIALLPDLDEEALAHYRRKPNERVRWTIRKEEEPPAPARESLPEVAFASTWF
jgi:putative phage-type endonuclease